MKNKNKINKNALFLQQVELLDINSYCYCLATSTMFKRLCDLYAAACITWGNNVKLENVSFSQ